MNKESPQNTRIVDRTSLPASLTIILLAALTALTAIVFSSGGPAQGQDATLPILAFRSYDGGWTRYFNQDADGARKLDIDGISKFPFRWISTPLLIRLADFDDPGFLATLMIDYDLTYDADRVDGECDTDRFGERSSDTLCVPGVASMPHGKIILALYHSNTFELVALTTAIDNSRGAAAIISRRNLPPTPTPRPTTCGPYAADQWITAEQYVNDGYTLPIRRENAGDPITHYQCVVPGDGSPYLQAYRILQVGSATSKDSGGSSSASSGSGGSGGGNGANPPDDDDDFDLN